MSGRISPKRIPIDHAESSREKNSGDPVILENKYPTGINNTMHTISPAIIPGIEK
jgi:hypothetical protein